MERSSFEVPFSPVLFCVAQALSEGPSCGQEVLSECASIRPKQAVPLPQPSAFLGSRSHTAALDSSYFSPCIFLPVGCAPSQPGLCCFFGVAVGQCQSPLLAAAVSCLKSTLWNIGLREHLAGLTRPLFCSVFFLSCLEVAKLVPDQAANRGKKKGKKNQFSSSLSTGLWKREVCSILWCSGGLFFPHLISLEMF